MPKKRFRKMVSVLLRIFKAHHAPQEIALGVALGVFIAIIPLYGFHTLLCIIAALLIPRANKFAILLGTNVSLPPTVATITWSSYDLGRLILARQNYPPLSWEYIRNFNITKISEFYYPLFIGSIVLGLLCSIVLYFITLIIATRIKNKRAQEK